MTDAYPRGAVARVEAQWSHRDFVEAVEPEYVMMKITHARRLMKNGETFASYFGTDEPNYIITTTVNDASLNLLHWERELEIIEAVDPDYHIPTDYSVYEDHDDDEQIDLIERCMEGTRWMHDQLADTDTEIIPLIKGLEREHRELCYETFDDLDLDYCAFYGTRYFTGGYGLRVNDLIEDVEDIAVEYDPDILAIGVLSPNYVRRLPTNVVAAAGQARWRMRVKPRKQSEAEMETAYGELADEVKQALDTPPYADEDNDEEATAD